MESIRYNAEEVGKRGREIYEQKLKHLLEPQNIGQFLVIDIETGEYEIGEDDLVVSMQAYRKKPEGIRYGIKIGYPTSGTIGNALLEYVS